MHEKPELIVMLTYNDVTVSNAYEIFENAGIQKLYTGDLKKKVCHRNR